MPAADLHVIHLKQVVPEEVLLEPPYLGADLYPKAKRAWYRKKRLLISIGVLLIFGIAGIIIGSVLGTRSNNSGADTTINWKGGMWAFACDFNTPNMAAVPTESSLCGPKCIETLNCTHFTWTDMNNGTCFMKAGNITTEDAVRTTDPTMICGVAYLSNYTRFNQTIDWQGRDWTYACDFSDDSFLIIRSVGADCGGLCLTNPPCTHFMWSKVLGGTCFLKQGNVTKDDALATNDANMVCGVAYTNDAVLLNETVQWNINSTAVSCDFQNNDLSNNQTAQADCSILCSKTPLCTHFTWSQYSGGTCFMKKGNVSRDDAFRTNDSTMVCGILLTV
ncbi:unnamed protein product [Adineta ricciae]|uniref:Apple domain-containing protein n=2 Tax=Adineta ricciae TaxID=249248 RepID=A0A815WQX7_ADIRI|nr:unnamed protein product [Adineta ricciae]